MADPVVVTVSPPDVWQAGERSLSHFQARWESVQVHPLPEGGRLLEIIKDDTVVFRARLDAAAASILALMLVAPVRR